ncbi:MAG TPA: HAD family hydrolase [Levilinea sp.]|nr:HAD family hydrolase [Levilinea sp.]
MQRFIGFRPLASRRFDLVLFDLGNTLIYFDGDWGVVLPRCYRVLANSLVEAGLELQPHLFAEEFGRRVIAAWENRSASNIEHTVEFILRQALHDFGVQDAPSAHLRPAIDAMFAVSQAHWRVEDDALAMLEQLRQAGYALGMISNASDNQDVQMLVDKAGVRDYFDQIIVSAAVGIRKPDPYIFRLALDHFGAAAERAVMIGDTLSADVLGAHNSGMSSVWITRRAGNPDNHAHRELITPHAAIYALDELPGLLANWQDGAPR